jgi:hypothetical protein
MANNEDDLHALSRDELEKRFMRTLIWYFGEKRWPTGFFNAMPERVEEVTRALSEVNKQLAESSKSQARLATALNIFTALLVIVGALQIIVPRIWGN